MNSRPLRPELAAVLADTSAPNSQWVCQTAVEGRRKGALLYFVLYAAPFLARPGTVLASCGRPMELVVCCLARAALIMFLA